MGASMNEPSFALAILRAGADEWFSSQQPLQAWFGGASGFQANSTRSLRRLIDCSLYQACGAGFRILALAAFQFARAFSPSSSSLPASLLFGKVAFSRVGFHFDAARGVNFVLAAGPFFDAFGWGSHQLSVSRESLNVPSFPLFGGTLVTFSR
jgi:hypothetical protein